MKILKTIILTALLMLMPAYAMAVESCAATLKGYGWLQYAWTAAADGSFTSTICTPAHPINGWVYRVQIDPGSTAPQALYDITLTDAQGEDVLAGQGSNLSATATASFDCNNFPVYGALTLNISGNNVNSAVGAVNIYFVPF